MEDRTLPHVVVKLWPGKSEQQKKRLADEITRSATSILLYGEESVSAAFEEIKSQDWIEKVYNPEIRDKCDSVVKKPGYTPADL
jgi:4-oxalocrotonate tautomerase